MGFSSTCSAPRIFHQTVLAIGGTDRLIFGTLITNKLEARGHMSSQNGDKARFNRLRKQKFRRRELMASILAI